MTYKRVLLGALILAICCMAGGAAVYIPSQLVPPISKQFPQDVSHLAVQILSPMRESRWPLNSFIPILVQAQAAEPIVQVELFINGTSLKSQIGLADTFNGTWSWQPGTAGDFMLTARATGKSGLTAVSTPLLIHAIAAGHTVSPVAVKQGDTLESIASAKNIPLEEIQQSNPKLDPSVPLQSGWEIFLPNAPGPVTNLELIEPLPEDNSQSGGGQSGGNQPPGEPSSKNGPEFIGTTTNFFHDLQYLWKTNPPVPVGNQTGPKYPPATPKLFGDFKGCDVTLRFPTIAYRDAEPGSGWMGWEDDGFFVYRSRDGGAFERIATLPPIHEAPPASNVTFADKGEYGALSYYVAAFNALGEAASNPVTFALNPGVCPSAGSGGEGVIGMDPDGNIILPFNMDMAYLYVQINDSAAVRVPEGTRMFLSGSGVRFNLYDYLSTISDSVRLADMKLHMEVWGWQGGNLVFAGTFDTELHRTVLSICSVPGEGACSGGGGDWVTSLTLPHDPALKDLKYDMHWQVTSLTSPENFMLTVSEEPELVGYDWKGLLYHGSLSKWVVNGQYMNLKTNEGTFPLDLGYILYPDPPPSPLGWDNTPSKLTEFRSVGLTDKPAGQPFQLYVHVYPQLGMDGYEHESNLVTLLYDTTAELVGMPPLESQYPSMYTVEILRDQFKQASHYVEPAPGEVDQWGCVIVDEDHNGQYAVGQPVCPPPPTSDYQWFPGEDPCGDIVSWFENCLLGGVEAAYTALKDTLAEGLIYIVPGCSDSTDCQDIVHKGIDYGAAYVTGIPPDLPSAEDLISGQISSEIIDLATGGLASATGIDQSVLGDFCDDVVDCQGKLSEPIKQQLQQARSQASQPACNALMAYYHNVEAFCLDPSIIVHPAPGAIDSPAVAVVRVTRKDKPEAQAVTDADKDKYRLFVTVSADPPPGSTMQHTDPFWKSAQVSIPWLQPGESIVLPATLEHIQYQDLDKYFTNGVGHMKAVETCYSSSSSWDWVPCQNGGSDSWDFPIMWNSALQGAIVQP
jgi:LysM repeat protein